MGMSRVKENKGINHRPTRTIVICPQCEGHGEVVRLTEAVERCNACRGHGRVEMLVHLQYLND